MTSEEYQRQHFKKIEIRAKLKLVKLAIIEVLAEH